MGRILIFVFLTGFFAAMMNSCTPRRSFSAKPHTGFESVNYDAERSSLSRASRNATVSDGSAVELQRDSDGHFYADVQINGTPVHMLVDTGATQIALSRADASSAGIATSIGMPEVVGEGADGAVHGEVVKLDRVTLGPRTAEDMRAVVLNGGEQSLLGQSFLSEFDSVEIRVDTMVLK
jgi:aspartyl protease family protein